MNDQAQGQVLGRISGPTTNAECVNGCGSAPKEATLTATIEVRASRNFADALMAAMSGQRITRAGWNGGGQHVACQWPDSRSKMTVPYLFLKNSRGDLVPWVPSQGDLFANDWAILPS